MSADAVTTAPAPLASSTRPFYWSVRRELWENRSVYLAPLSITALVLFALIVGLFTHTPRQIALVGMDAERMYQVAVKPFRMAPAPLMLASFLVGAFYALDALYGERRDRSILFWKSLPVSDRTAVLAKATIPMAVLPLIAFALSMVVLVALLALSSPMLAAKGVSVARLWREVLLVQPVIMLYGLAAHTLWFAPLYGWLLLVSAWARRTPFLWALSPIALAIVERVAFPTTYVCGFFKYRVVGAMAEAFIPGPASKGNVTLVVQLDPLGFLTSPGLWLGLAFAAGCVAAAIRLRRHRDPV